MSSSVILGRGARQTRRQRLSLCSVFQARSPFMWSRVGLSVDLTSTARVASPRTKSTSKPEEVRQQVNENASLYIHAKQKLNLGQNGCLGDLFVGFSRNLFQVRTRTGFCYRSNGSYDLPVRLSNNFKPRPALSLTIRLLSRVKCV